MAYNKFGGGFGGGQMQQLMKQAQQMQQEIQKAHEELENAQLEGVAGGGLVKVVVNGKKVLQNVSINPGAVDTDDIEMLEDLIASAMKVATDKSKSEMESKMKSVTGGVNIPGLTI